MKFKNKLLIGIKVIKSKLFNQKIPLVVGWAITNRCNYRCKYCGIWKKKERELSTQQVFSIIDELKQTGCQRIVFTGGEPLLRKDIGRIINYCKENCFEIGINSNGSLFKEKINEIKKIDTLTLSLDGPDKIQDKLRAKGSYKKTIEAIEIAQKNNINVFLTTVVSKQNLNRLEYILDVAKKYNIFVGFQPVSYRHNQQKIEKFRPLIKSYREKIDWIINLKKNGNKHIGNSISGLKHLRNWPKPKKIKCAAGIIRCRIEPNGDLYPCGVLVGGMNPQNCADIGFKKAFNKLKKVNCKACWCFNNVELNLAYSLNINTIKNLLKTILR